MKIRSSWRHWVALVACGAAWATAGANSVNLSYLQGLTPVAPEAITAYGPELFGDKINLFNGALGFEHNDLSLPGNSRLPVALGRSHTPGRAHIVRGQFGDWDLEAPRITGSYSTALGWVPTRSGGGRCSAYSAPPHVPKTAAVSYLSTDYWNGVTLKVPGAGEQEILVRSATFSASPADGHHYPLVTRQNWQIRCLPSLQNAAGEGFVAVSPEGMSYRFDWLASRTQTNMRKGGQELGRQDMFLMATQVADRFGNWVRYTYDPANPLLLSRIDANDGREIRINNALGRAVSATDGTRTYHYSYTAAGQLSSVQQPDGSRWAFDLAPMVPDDFAQLGANATCDSPGDFPGTAHTGRITHPSGAVGSFTTAFTMLGRSRVTRTCWYAQNSTTVTTGAVWPRLVLSQAITSKRIDGPGMPSMQWTYAYNAPGSWSTCANCQTTRLVSVTEPTGAVTRHTFGNRWRVDEGQLLSVEEGWNGSTALQLTEHRYRQPTGQNFPDQFGTSLVANSDWLASRNRPPDQRKITLHRNAFVWAADASRDGFDAYARPVRVKKSGLTSTGRTEDIVYFDHLPSWVLGQTARVTERGTGQEMEAHTYHPANGLRTESFEFGRRVASFGYHPDGNLRAITDPANRSTLLDSYRRGSPQLLSFADGHTERQAINNLGNADSQTNAAGTTTWYQYDAMGRVSGISHPGGDAVAYHATQQAFEQVAGSEYGLGAGHWRQSITTGNARLLRYFDGLWRPRLEVRYDAADAGNTTSFKEFRFDAGGRKVFESYPERTFTTVDAARPGKASAHDAIHRVIAEEADSELGKLRTTTQYPEGLYRRVVTNARGQATTFGLHAFDAPGEASIVSIQAPETVTVSITRDVFGKAKSISRSGNNAGTATRRYVYDQHQRLCKTIDPETAATVQAYDTAGNLAWRSSGNDLPSLVSCDQGSVPDARKAFFGYDARNRLVSTVYGDGSPAITRSYTPDGKPAQTRTPQWTWTYAYNNRRLLSQETYSVNGNHYSTSHRHDAYGHLARIDYWGGINIDYAPNALGQPTAVSSYLRQVRWHPNGALASYTMANGISHSMQQNLRGLPAVWSDSGVTRDVYRYDQNANVVEINDEQRGATTRSMGYDGLDRLTTANGPWGSGQFTYDALDNLRSSRVGGNSLTYLIHPSTRRLTQVYGSQNLAFSYDANGNLAQRGSQAYVFDIANRLSTVVGKASYQYDGEGRRVWVAHADGSVASQAYSLDGKLRLAGHSVHGSTWFIYLGDRVVAEYNNKSGFSYVHTDALGSPVARTSPTGALLSRTLYEPFGATSSGTLPPGNALGFTGHLNDAQTGLVYMQQRYYDPVAGRFLSC